MPGLGQAVAKCREVIAIEDAHAVAGDALRVEAADLLDQPRDGLLYREGGTGVLDAVRLVVKGGREAATAPASAC